MVTQMDSSSGLTKEKGGGGSMKALIASTNCNVVIFTKVF